MIQLLLLVKLTFNGGPNSLSSVVQLKHTNTKRSLKESPPLVDSYLSQLLTGWECTQKMKQNAKRSSLRNLRMDVLLCLELLDLFQPTSSLALYQEHQASK